MKSNKLKIKISQKILSALDIAFTVIMSIFKCLHLDQNLIQSRFNIEKFNETPTYYGFHS